MVREMLQTALLREWKMADAAEGEDGKDDVDAKRGC